MQTNAPSVLAEAGRLVDPKRLRDWFEGLHAADRRARDGGLGDPRLREYLATGIEPLDAWLPGGGLLWGAVHELFAAPGAGGYRLATSLLARALAEDPGRLGAILDPERDWHAPALAQAGVPLERLLVIRPRGRSRGQGWRDGKPTSRHQRGRGGGGRPATRAAAVRSTRSPEQLRAEAVREESLWTLEQVLLSGTIDIVLAHLPATRLPPTSVQRLQTATERGGGLLILLRPHAARHARSAARTRLVLEPLSLTPGEQRLQPHPLTYAIRIASRRARGAREPGLDAPLIDLLVDLAPSSQGRPGPPQFTALPPHPAFPMPQEMGGSNTLSLGLRADYCRPARRGVALSI